MDLASMRPSGAALERSDVRHLQPGTWPTARCSHGGGEASRHQLAYTAPESASCRSALLKGVQNDGSLRSSAT